jgi:hypothetical protein
MSGPGFTPPDLCSIRAAAEQAEHAGAVQGLLSADGYLLASDGPLALLTSDSAPRSRQAAFMRDRCARHEPLCWPARVCLMPIPESGTGRSAIAVSRTSHDLLPDWGCRATCSHICQLVNAVPGSVLQVLSHLDRQRATAGACQVTSRHGQRAEAGR